MPRGKAKAASKYSSTKGHSFIQEIAEEQQPSRIVCPNCGGVWVGDERIGIAEGMEAYIIQGYDPTACPDCVATGRAVGSSGEFNFNEGVIE